MIVAGRVSVNGSVVARLGACIVPGSDIVLVDGRRVFPERKLYFLLNKPCGVLSTCSDTHGRSTFLQFFPGIQERLYPVGRLDQDSEGLLLVTNDGALALTLMHPRHEVPKTYHVRLNRELTPDAVRRLIAGIRSEGQTLKADSVAPVRGQRHEYRVVLREGRKRQIRRMAEGVGARVLALRRTAIGSLTLGTLPLGKARALSGEELARLRREAGLVDGAAGGNDRLPLEA